MMQAIEYLKNTVFVGDLDVACSSMLDQGGKVVRICRDVSVSARLEVYKLLSLSMVDLRFGRYKKR